MHPYRLELNHYEKFRKRSWFASGSKGIPAEFPNGKYLYKLMPAIKLANYARGWFATPSRTPDPSYLIRLLIHDYTIKKDWLQYSAYASGYFSSPRNITFWTSLEFDPNDIMTGANKIGLVNNWIVEQMVILRVPVNELKKRHHVFVPTVLDAFDVEVFHPTEDFANPTSGVTIHLHCTDPLTCGVDEYVIEPIPVEPIEFIPLLLDTNDIENKGVRSDTLLWLLLLTYYNNLL
jgi:hypothetical protein